MEISEVWKDYNKASLHLSYELGRSNNLVDEYAEHLINGHLKGTLLDLSHTSATIKKYDALYQVKSSRLDTGEPIILSVIHSWNFDYLAVVIFNNFGAVQRALIIPVAIAKEAAVIDEYQNGYVITTNRDFFNIRRFEDITKSVRILNGEDISKTAEILPIRTRTFEKLHKIKGWANHPDNYNHRIIKAYLALSDVTDVKKKDLLEFCSNLDLKPNFYVEKFNQNFSSMKTDAGHSHGKVFFEDKGYVYMYPQALEEIKQWF